MQRINANTTNCNTQEIEFIVDIAKCATHFVQRPKYTRCKWKQIESIRWLIYIDGLHAPAKRNEK